jgi:hypothetical protein
MVSVFLFKMSQLSPLEVKGESVLKLKDFLKNDIENPSCSIFDLNLDKELDLNKSLDELGVENNHRVIISSCKKVEVTVDYAGQPPFIDSFNYHNKIGKVLRKALEHFNIPDGEKTLFELFSDQNSKEPLGKDLPICTVVAADKCKVNLFLSKTVDYKG